jgi:hypothetical protein
MPVLTLVRRESGYAVAPFLAAGIVAIGFVVAWLHLDHLPVTMCVFKVTTGIPCMTCGTTRALGSLGRLDPAAALRINPLATVVAFVLLGIGVVQLALLPSGRRLRLAVSPAVSRWLWILFGVAALVNWIYLIRHGV